MMSGVTERDGLLTVILSCSERSHVTEEDYSFESSECRKLPRRSAADGFGPLEAENRLRPSPDHPPLKNTL